MLYDVQPFGLGALPAFPPASGLSAGNEWVRYLLEADKQWQSCPPNAPHGCTMYNGYAWGQRQAGIGEFNFVYIAPQTATGEAEVVTDYREQCHADLRTWLSSFPELGACLNDNEWSQLYAWCEARYAGQISLNEFTRRRASLVESACIRKGCENFYRAWANQFPDLAACMTDVDRNAAMRVCAQAEKGAISRDRAAEQLHQIVVTACERETGPVPPAPAPSPAPAPPPDTAPAPAPTGPAPGDVLPTPDGGLVVDEGAPLPAPAPSSLRQLGPVVGIGLLLAVGLTVATQQTKKGKKRRKRG